MHTLYLSITGFRIISQVLTHPESLPQLLVVTWHLHLTSITTKASWVRTIRLGMQFEHNFCITIKHINAKLSIGNNKNKKGLKCNNNTLSSWKTLTYQIQKEKKGQYHLLVVEAAMSQRSFPHDLYSMSVFLFLLWQCNTPKFSYHYIFYVVRPPRLTSPPPQSSFATYIAPHDTRDPLVD
jgi:hypothetical protein